MGSLVQFFQDKTILVTGGTGFLAKMMVEKILRVQPNVKKIFILIRAADAKSATRRLHNEVIGTDLFKVLREMWGEGFTSRVTEKVIPVPGDIAREDLRLEDSDIREEMYTQIDCIVNSAATTKFDERYDVATSINVMGAKNVLNFAKKCTNIKMLLHVSTAYVCGQREGLVPERPFKMGETLNGSSCLEIDAEMKLVETKLTEMLAENATEKEVTKAMKNLGMQRAAHYGWPNTYVFTKAMGEMLMGHHKGDLPLVILRPSIITSTYKEPFPGWIEGLRTLDSFAVGYGKGKLRFLVLDRDSVSDMIPGDMVVNSMLAAMALNSSQTSHDQIIIYHLGSSLRNPLRCAIIQDCAFHYFTENPWISGSGSKFKVGKLRVFSDMASFQKYVAIRYLLPLKVFGLLNVALGHYLQGTYIKLERKIKFVVRLMEIYLPYLLFKGIFDDTNTEELRMAVKGSGEVDQVEVFNFDPKCIVWEDYFMNTHYPGIVKYLF